MPLAGPRVAYELTSHNVVFSFTPPSPPFSSDGLQALVVCSVFPHLPAVLPEEDTMPPVLPGGPAKLPVHPARQRRPDPRGQPQLHLHRCDGTVISPSVGSRDPLFLRVWPSASTKSFTLYQTECDALLFHGPCFYRAPQCSPLRESFNKRRRKQQSVSKRPFSDT